MFVLLQRFGLPARLLAIIKNIYTNRSFCVAGGVQRSHERQQRSGIAQGCPLSPILFVMVMTVIIQDATATLNDPAKTEFQMGNLSVLLYADDTLIFGKHQEHMQELLNAIATSGGKAGMELHWDKFQVLHVQNDIDLHSPSGALIQPKDRLVYLGATISNTGRISGELNRRLGTAWGEFSRYCKVWKRTSIGVKKKLLIFDAMITSKVMYSLSSAWLTRADRKRLDGFQAKCIRRILHIPPAFISRVSNKCVWGKKKRASAVQLPTAETRATTIWKK